MKKFIFEMLIERLKWPDMLVREQTFNAIKDFLIANKVFKDNFLVYLETQHLESKILEFLAIIYLVNLEKANYFTLEEIDSKINASSLLSEKCLEEIFGIELLDKDRLWMKNHSSYMPSNFTKVTYNHRPNGLVKSNLDCLNKIYEFELPVEDQFNFEYYKSMEKTNCPYYGVLDYFCETRHAGFPNIKLYQDDIQISAFLKLISFYVDNYNLPIDIAFILVEDFFPADFGLLELRPITKPLFINNLIEYDFKQWDFKEDDYIPIYLSCPLDINTNSFSDKEIISIEVYPVHLSHIPPSLEEHFNFFRQGELGGGEIKKIPCHTNIKNSEFLMKYPNILLDYFINVAITCKNYIRLTEICLYQMKKIFK